jgi:hypothetical protein
MDVISAVVQLVPGSSFSICQVTSRDVKQLGACYTQCQQLAQAADCHLSFCGK